MGLDRLLTAMERLEMIPRISTPADVLIVHFDSQRLGDYLAIAAALRQQGLKVEVYPEAKKLGHQFKYANRRGFQAAIVAGPEELENQQVQVKWMESGQQMEIPIGEGYEELAQHLVEQLNSGMRS